jgi:hypothetical protein
VRKIEQISISAADRERLERLVRDRNTHRGRNRKMQKNCEISMCYGGGRETRKKLAPWAPLGCSRSCTTLVPTFSKIGSLDWRTQNCEGCRAAADIGAPSEQFGVPSRSQPLGLMGPSI